MIDDVRLEPLSLDHLDHVMSWVNDHEVLQYFANRQSDITRADEERYLRTLLASPNDRAFSVFAGTRYIGQVSINQIYWPAKNGRLFVVVKKSEQGNGFGPAAIRALLPIAWEQLGLHKLWLIVRKDNRRSQAMYLQLGFDFEGVLLDEYFVGGRFHDMVRMSLRRPDAPPR